MRIRNLGILAHIDAGKTTLTEQLLYLTGAVRRPGSVDDGTTSTDWRRQERERGITIGSAAIGCEWRDVRLTIVDTPGHVDFTIEVERCLRVVDGGVVVLSGPDGVQAQTETVCQQAARHGLPLIGFVNKLDREGYEPAPFEREVRERIGLEPVPLQIVLEPEGPRNVVLLDVLTGTVERWALPSRRGHLAECSWRPMTADEEVEREVALEHIVDAVANYDDALTEAALTGRALDPAMIWRALRAAAGARACLPLIYGVARHGVGVRRLADALVDALPSPSEASPPPTYPPPTGTKRGGAAASLAAAHVDAPSPAAASPAVATAAFVFKTEARPGGLRLLFVRSFAGTLRAADRLIRLPVREAYRPTELVRVMGGAVEPTDAIGPGEIGGILEPLGRPTPLTGDTLATPGFDRCFEPVGVPEPVISVVLEAEDSGGDREMREALVQIAEDDPSIVVRNDPDTGACRVAGMGELHLQLLVERLRGTLATSLTVGEPRPRYRYLLASAGTGRGHHDAETVPARRVEATIAVRPLPDAMGRVVRWECTPPSRPGEREAFEAGIHAGLRRSDPEPADIVGAEVRVVAVNASGEPTPPGIFHAVAMAACQDAVEAAGPRLAEPWVRVTIVAPSDHVGRIVADLGRRRGRVAATESRGAVQALDARAPLGELIGYATALRSLTAGRGRFTMTPDGYEALGDSP